MTTPAPEPVEVGADELAAAERRFRALATRYPMGGVDHARVLMDEYDRRGRELHARNVDAKSATIQAVGLRAERDRLRAFLLEATGTLPAHGFADNELGDPWPRWLERVAAYLTETHR